MWDIGTFADLSNIVTLFAFIIVSVGVMVLRRTQPERARAFRVPLSPVMPAISVLSCLGLMSGLLLDPGFGFASLAIGLVIFSLYGKRRSPLFGA